MGTLGAPLWILKLTLLPTKPFIKFIVGPLPNGHLGFHLSMTMPMRMQ
jgi:hypothetical protein